MATKDDKREARVDARALLKSIDLETIGQQITELEEELAALRTLHRALVPKERKAADGRPNRGEGLLKAVCGVLERLGPSKAIEIAAELKRPPQSIYGVLARNPERFAKTADGQWRLASRDPLSG